jgi:hypothetical protein
MSESLFNKNVPYNLYRSQPRSLQGTIEVNFGCAVALV